MIEQIDNSLIRQDGQNIRLQADKGDLVCSYSSKRYQKDKYEMQKQIERASLVIANPSRNKKTKYTLISGEKIKLNEKLIEKNKKLLGIKGYYTDLKEKEVSNHTVIERYHELYKIEQAFRISKSDLQTRPIFHYKEEPIKLHILICFIALVLSKHIELQTLTSIKRFIHGCKKITDARLLNKITGKEIIMRVPLNTEVTDFLQKLKLLT
ncbi:MAG TPA: transposase [Niabella sp.]|nr:transposase [Niabella sp.]